MMIVELILLTLVNVAILMFVSVFRKQREDGEQNYKFDIIKISIVVLVLLILLFGGEIIFFTEYMNDGR